MRRLGAELGVDPMTVYGHLADKAALFDGLIELVLAEVKVPPPTGAWAANAIPHTILHTNAMHSRIDPFPNDGRTNEDGFEVSGKDDSQKVISFVTA